MKFPTILFLSLVVATHGLAIGDELRSGLQVGERPTPFNVLDCTGPASGKTLCYYCRYESRPVVSVFTRELNDDVIKLVKAIDNTVLENREQRMAAFVVYLSDDVFDAQRKLKRIAEEQGIKRTPLTIFRDTQAVLRENYSIAADAAVTIMMWDGGKVVVNQALATANLSDDDMRTIVKKTSKILD